MSDDASDIIVDDDILTEEELKFITENITNWNFPFFVRNATGNIFVMTHEFIGRHSNGKIWNESCFYFFDKIIERFCKKYSLSYEIIYRACINLGFENSEFKQSHPHIDLNYTNIKQFRNLLIYLNDVTNESGYNSTILYKEKGSNLDFNKNIMDFSKLENFTIQRVIEPKKGRIVCYDGFRYHANYFSKGNELRCVAVFNFS